MVGCDMCDVWFHPGCVEVTETNLNPDKTWKCAHCANDEDREVASQHTNKSMRSSASSRARKELLLRQLEEQRALKLKQRAEEDEIRKKRAEEDEAFLQQKLDIILEDDNESRISRLSSRASQRKVADWLNHDQAGHTVATSSSPNRVVSQQSSAQQFALSSRGTVAQASTNVVPPDGVPASTSTPQSDGENCAKLFSIRPGDTGTEFRRLKIYWAENEDDDDDENVGSSRRAGGKLNEAVITSWTSEIEAPNGRCG
nr:uncharacterized protein LOC115258434 [Aedes albopictus]